MMNYLLIALYLGPWLLFWLGAELRLRRQTSRPARLQRWTARAIVFLNALMILNFNPHFGLDYYGVKAWSYPLQVADSSVFWVGMLLLGLGFFLERRPGPGFQPWPKTGKAVCALSILCGLSLGWWASRNVHLAWIDLPWSIARFVASLGFWPLAVGYFQFSRRQRPAPLPT
ncbi:MAG: hypothetical protein HYV27_01665 [Candidatus Hydrogenedentes bacterium]|nr:hypothetical protein [Candidatus Hydrogenedentota bacterium]